MLGEIPDLEGVSQVWIVHSTKAGNYKGDSELGHLVDIMITCDNGVGRVQKNRFAPLSEIVIFGSNKDEENDVSFLPE